MKKQLTPNEKINFERIIRKHLDPEFDSMSTEEHDRLLEVFDSTRTFVVGVAFEQLRDLVDEAVEIDGQANAITTIKEYIEEVLQEC